MITAQLCVRDDLNGYVLGNQSRFGLTSVYDAESNDMDFVRHGISLDIEDFYAREGYNLIVCTNADIAETRDLIFSYFNQGMVGAIVLVDEDSKTPYESMEQFSAWLEDAIGKRDDYRQKREAMRSRRNWKK
jgi:hypothetical protein